MAFRLSGLIGAEGQAALQEALRLRLLEQEQRDQAQRDAEALRIRQQELESATADRALLREGQAEDRQRRQQLFDWQQLVRAQDLEQAKHDAKIKQGIETNLAGLAAMPGMSPEEKRNQMYATAAGGGMGLEKASRVITDMVPIEKPTREPNIPMEQQLLNAINSGDTQAENRIRAVMNARDQPAAGQKPITATAESNLINRLSSQWTKASEPARKLDQQVALMRTGLNAARRGDMAAGSQAVLVTFQKILDPPSVVRESEYMRSGAGLPLLERVRGWYERLKVGGAGVPLAELEKFAKLAEEAAKAQQTGYLNSVRKRIGKTAARYSIPEELVFDYEGGVPEPEKPLEPMPMMGGRGPAAPPAAPAEPSTGSSGYQAYLDRRKNRGGG